MATNPAQPFIQPQPQPGFPGAVATQPQPQPGYPPYPPYYGPATPPPQQMPSRSTVSGDEVLDGAGVPPELRGRKLSEAMRIYSALADDFIRRGRPAQPQNNQPAPGSQPQTQPQGNNQMMNRGLQPQPQQPQPQGNESIDFWQNPDQKIQEIVQRVVGEAVGPFTQQSQSSAIHTAREQARQRVPDFQALEADILEAVKGASGDALGRVEFWENAADLARGKRMRPGQVDPHAAHRSTGPEMFGAHVTPGATPNVAPQSYPQATPPGPINQPMIPGMNPAVPQFVPTNQRPQTNQFFSEAPTAPSPYQNTHAGSLTAQELRVAELSGMSPEQYQAWKNIQQRGPAR